MAIIKSGTTVMSVVEARAFISLVSAVVEARAVVSLVSAVVSLVSAVVSLVSAVVSAVVSVLAVKSGPFKCSTANHSNNAHVASHGEKNSVEWCSFTNITTKTWVGRIVELVEFVPS